MSLNNIDIRHKLFLNVILMFQPYNFHLFKAKLCWAKKSNTSTYSYMVISEVKSKTHPQFMVAVNYPVGISVGTKSQFLTTLSGVFN